MSNAARGDLSKLPSMTALLEAAGRDAALSRLPRAVCADALRDAVSEARTAALNGGIATIDAAALLTRAGAIAEQLRVSRLRCVINATGIVLHTGLGRSVLAEAAVQRLLDVASGYCSLEIDLATGERGRRGAYAESLIRRLTGAAAALVVNNNAAATMLALRALAFGKEVIVSRGQLVEIGGSYRLPDVMSAGGAILREVGTTNKTHLRDYEAAIGPRTGLIMHVHTSNFRIVGFSESPGVVELAALARSRGLPMLDDLGSGALLDGDVWTAAKEPTVATSLRSGADLVAFSGDKLLGGPQAGILIGRADVIEKLRSDPMTRAVRVDKLTLAALEATLALYLDPAVAAQSIPTLARLSEKEDALQDRAAELLAQMQAARPRDAFEIISETSYAGGGSLPAWPLPTRAIRWRPSGVAVQEVCDRLRLMDPAILVRLRDDAILLDLRTISPGEYELIAAAASKLTG